jgi:hypothetical protein
MGNVDKRTVTALLRIWSKMDTYLMRKHKDIHDLCMCGCVQCLGDCTKHVFCVTLAHVHGVQRHDDIRAVRLGGVVSSIYLSIYLSSVAVVEAITGGFTVR